MSESKTTSSNAGCGLLLTGTFFVFLVLKLIGKIDWSWWWVTAPLWGGLAVALVIVVPCIIVLYALAKRR
jgi:hypothetical protein